VDRGHEVIYRLKEGNSTKWLFSSSLTVCLESHITTERITSTGFWFGHSTSCLGVNGFLATKHPKKHQNGHLPGVKKTAYIIYKRLLLTQEFQEALVLS
jgi:hypothetical protein